MVAKLMKNIIGVSNSIYCDIVRNPTSERITEDLFFLVLIHLFINAIIFLRLQ